MHTFNEAPNNPCYLLFMPFIPTHHSCAVSAQIIEVPQQVVALYMSRALSKLGILGPSGIHHLAPFTTFFSKTIYIAIV